MGTIWGQASETEDLGVVAEQCPYCEPVTSCIVRVERLDWHVFFVKLAMDIKETSCLCRQCGNSFPCELWRYPVLVPAQEAEALPVADLLARTNPGLAERVQLNEQVSALGGDAVFAAAYEQLEGMRRGELREGLLNRLLQWERLTDEQRACLVRQIAAVARAWHLARQVARGFAGQTGCLPALLAALLVWSAFLWTPIVHSRLWGAVTVVAGFAAAGFARNLFLARQVRRWTREVLVPEARRANVSLACFLTVVDDLPGERMGIADDLWPVKDQLKAIRGVLMADRGL